MSVFYRAECTECTNYVSGEQSCFKYVTVDKGTVFSAEHKKDKYLFFFLEGSAEVSYNEFPP